MSTFTAKPGNAGGTLTAKSPLGRTATTELDNHARITSARRAAGEQPYTTTYDDAADGRVTRQAQGDRGVTYGYDAAGRVTSSTDDTGRVTTFTHDAANRLRDDDRRRRDVDHDLRRRRPPDRLPAAERPQLDVRDDRRAGSTRP